MDSAQATLRLFGEYVQSDLMRKPEPQLGRMCFAQHTHVWRMILRPEQAHGALTSTQKPTERLQTVLVHNNKRANMRMAQPTLFERQKQTRCERDIHT